GNGTTTNPLIVSGLSITVDARALGATGQGVPQVWIDGQPVSGATAALSLRLLPGSHIIGSQGGNTYTFTVDERTGLISSVVAPKGVFSGVGTTTLTINGVATTIDAHLLGTVEQKF